MAAEEWYCANRQTDPPLLSVLTEKKGMQHYAST